MIPPRIFFIIKPLKGSLRELGCLFIVLAHCGVERLELLDESEPQESGKEGARSGCLSEAGAGCVSLSL